MTHSLRQRLIGAWSLVACVEEPVDGSPIGYPLGDSPHGLLLYTPDGYVSAQLMRTGQPNFVSEDWAMGSDTEMGRAMSGYLAYSGPFAIDEQAQTVRHEVFVALFPNWVGHSHMRVVLLDGDKLELRSPAPSVSGGRSTIVRVTWKRAAPRA